MKKLILAIVIGVLLFQNLQAHSNEIDFNKGNEITCYRCNGLGLETCPVCNGSGIQMYGIIINNLPYPFFDELRIICTRCHGSGKIPCTLCGGLGSLLE